MGEEKQRRERGRQETINTAKAGNGQAKARCNGQSNAAIPRSLVPSEPPIHFLFISFSFFSVDPQFLRTFLLQTLRSPPTFPFVHRAACRLIVSPWVSHYPLISTPRTSYPGPRVSATCMLPCIIDFHAQDLQDSQDSAKGETIICAPVVICLCRGLDDAPERGAPRAWASTAIGHSAPLRGQRPRPMASLESKVTERIPKLPFCAGYGLDRPHQANEQMQQIQMLDLLLLSSIPRCMQHQIYSDFEISCGAPRSKGLGFHCQCPDRMGPHM